MEAKTLNDKAMLLAKTDFLVNGSYRNQPYAIRHEGEIYKAKIISGSRPDEQSRLVIVRPESCISSTTVSDPE